MESLKEIVNSLERTEIGLIENYLKCQINGNNGKRLKLFKLIRKRKVDSDKKAAKTLYKTVPNSTYYHLKNRLKQDVLDLLMLNRTYGSNNSDQPYTKAQFDFSRLQLLVMNLTSKEVQLETSRAITTMRFFATQHELPLESILVAEMETLYQEHLQSIPDTKRLILYAEEQFLVFKHVYMARMCFKNLYYAQMATERYDKNDLGNTVEVLVELKKDLDQKESVIIRYWYCLLSTMYNWIFYNYKQGIKFAVQALEVVKQHPERFSPKQTIKTKLLSAILHLQVGNYRQSEEEINQVLQNVSPDSIGYLQLLEPLVHIKFFESDVKAASGLIQEGISHPKLDRDNLRKAKWQYYQAYLEFSKGNFQESLNLLFHNKEITKYKSKWLIGCKLLELMNLIELEKYDLAEYRFEALKQLLKRQKGRNDDRIKLIRTLLGSLIKKDFDFNKTGFTCSKELKSLAQKSGQYRWVPFGYELVRFDRWLVTKINTVELYPVPGADFNR